MGMSWAEAVTYAKDIWWFASVPIAALGFVAMYYLRGQFPTKAEYNEQNKALTESVKDLSDKIDANERKTVERLGKSEREMSERMAKLEGDVQQLPGRPELENLSDRISRVEVQVAASVETIKGVDKTTSKIDHTLGMILDHMLDAAKEKKS
ncbi:MAG: hypothetical protein ACOY6K_22420 [Pseudomonadota bacterium]